MNKVREPTSKVFATFCAKRNLITTAIGIDRHGSYVWEAGAEVDGLSRYITLELTRQRDDAEDETLFLVSIIVAADGYSYTNSARG